MPLICLGLHDIFKWSKNSWMNKSWNFKSKFLTGNESCQIYLFFSFSLFRYSCLFLFSIFKINLHLLFPFYTISTLIALNYRYLYHIFPKIWFTNMLWDNWPLKLFPSSLSYLRSKVDAKGQIISKCLFGVFTFFQKTNENKSTSSCLFLFRKKRRLEKII